MTDESPRRLYKIGEVCRIADVQPYVLRYWETEFPALTPQKSSGGQRMYSEREVEIIQRVKFLLYTERLTIAGAKKRLDRELNADMELIGRGDDEESPSVPLGEGSRDTLRQVRRDLQAILELLKN